MAQKRKWPRGIYKRKVCWQCPDRETVASGVSTSKKTGRVCVHADACPDDKMFEPDYWIRYNHKGKLIRECVGPNMKLALKALAARKGEIAQGRFSLEDVKPSIGFKQFVEENYMPYAKVNKKSWDRDERAFRHLIEFFEDTPLGRITQWNVEQYKSKRRGDRGLSSGRQIMEGTVNRELASLSNAFTKAIEWGFAESSPVSGVRFFRAKRRDRYLSREEIVALLHVCSKKGSKASQLRAVVMTALHTGMRKGEVLGLRWEDIDWRRRTIRLEGDRTKNSEPRLVEVNSVLLEELREYRKLSKGEYLFSNSKGQPLKNVRERLYRAYEKADIVDATFHTLRHTWASHAVMNGTDLLTVQKMGGWKSLKMVERYAHLSREHQQKAAEKLGEVFKLTPVYSENDKIRDLEDKRRGVENV